MTTRRSGVADAAAAGEAGTVKLCECSTRPGALVTGSVGRARRNHVPVSVIVTGTVVPPAADVNVITPW
ncbi:MAG: hypothetical protein IPJ78_07555 [Gemmatimonadetes bacterium]|nr:hypothetical protein [Gemmatimonadota bacterium]